MRLTYIGVVGNAAANGADVTVFGSALTAIGAVSGDILILLAFTHYEVKGGTGTSASFLNRIIYDLTSESRTSSLYWGWWDGNSPVVFAGTRDTADAMAVIGQVWRRDNDDGSSPIGDFSEATGTSTNPNPPSVTPDTDDCAVIVMAGSSAYDTNPGVMSGYTLVNGYAAADSNSASAHSAYNILSGQSGVSQNPPAWSAWSTGSWHAYSLILRPSLIRRRSPIVVPCQAIKRAANW